MRPENSLKVLIHYNILKTKFWIYHLKTKPNNQFSDISRVRQMLHITDIGRSIRGTNKWHQQIEFSAENNQFEKKIASQNK